MKDMRNLAILLLLVFASCKKDNSVQPLAVKTTVPTSHRDYDYFIHQNLPGNWTRVREYIRGPYIIIDHPVYEMTIPVTLTYWYAPGNVLSYHDGIATIDNYQRLGSSDTWKIAFTSNDAFSLSNTVTTGDYINTEIVDYYKRVH